MENKEIVKALFERHPWPWVKNEKRSVCSANSVILARYDHGWLEIIGIDGDDILALAAEYQRLAGLVSMKDDALTSYAEFYDRAAKLCGLPEGANPSEQTDNIILQRLAENEILLPPIDHARLVAENAKLRKALEGAEWAYDGLTKYCPWCQEEYQTHAPDCPRQVALGLEAK